VTAKADAIELKNDEARKELVLASEVEKTWSDIIINAKTKLLSLPSKIAPLAAETDSPRLIAEQTKQIIYEVLEELAKPDTYKKRKHKKVAPTT